MRKCLKRTKNTKNHKHTKNRNHITCCSSDRERTSLLSILDHFVPLPHFWPKNQNFQKMKKAFRDIIILHTVRCLINLGAKINVGDRDFSYI